MSYLVWGPWDGVDGQAHAWWVFAALALFHVAVGAAISRWWAVGLPLAWALLSVGAEGYDTPVWIVILFQAPLAWAPAVAIGVAARKLGRRPSPVPRAG
ncbi:MAG TPA: hypothetical protein VFW80_00550 [Gaiellaceae bacterium]|nr:hypothetical protein [Gaiellaceae bacterium]